MHHTSNTSNNAMACQVGSIYSPQVASIHSPPTFGARIYSPQVGSCSEGQIQKQLEQMEHARSREMVAHSLVSQPHGECLWTGQVAVA